MNILRGSTLALVFLLLSALHLHAQQTLTVDLGQTLAEPLRIAKPYCVTDTAKTYLTLRSLKGTARADSLAFQGRPVPIGSLSRAQFCNLAWQPPQEEGVYADTLWVRLAGEKKMRPTPFQYAVWHCTQIEFDTLRVNTGVTVSGAMVKATWEFTNTGSHDCLVVEGKGPSGDVQVSFPQERIPPGGRGTITARFATETKVGVTYKPVVVKYNGGAAQLIFDMDVRKPEDMPVPFEKQTDSRKAGR